MEVRKAIFLDKDGTLIPDIPYNVNPNKVSLSDNSIEGLRMLQENGFELIVVTNQTGIANGLFHPQELLKIEMKISSLLEDNGIKLSGFYYCPHDPNALLEAYRKSCKCKKPKPGMLLNAAEEHQLDLKYCWMIGDILHDIEAGNRAGCKSILINNGNETEWKMNRLRTPDLMTSDINQAAKYISEMTATFSDGIENYYSYE